MVRKKIPAKIRKNVNDQKKQKDMADAMVAWAKAGGAPTTNTPTPTPPTGGGGGGTGGGGAHP